MQDSSLLNREEELELEIGAIFSQGYGMYELGNTVEFLDYLVTL